MDFLQDAVERAMPIRDVLVRAISGQYSWIQAANILGMSQRTLRRLAVADGSHRPDRADRHASGPTVTAEGVP